MNRITASVLPLLVAAFLASALFAVPALAGDYAAHEPPRDFRGMQWGTPLSEISGMVPVPAKGYKNTYYRKDEPLTFGDADIVSVAYYFKDGLLSRVGVAFKGQANQFLIKDKLIHDFGPGRQVGSRYGWMWKDFSMVIDYNASSDTGALYYTFEKQPKK